MTPNPCIERTSASPLLEFIAQDFSRSDLIAMAALGVAGLSALYTRRQADEARKSRLSAEREARRPQRLEIYRELEEYCRYCSTYYTAYLQRTVSGTRELTARIDRLRTAMEQGAIFDMPAVSETSRQLQNMGWKMQRHLDRIGDQAIVFSSAMEAAKDATEVEKLVELFEKQRKELRNVFALYLDANSQV